MSDTDWIKPGAAAVSTQTIPGKRLLGRVLRYESDGYWEFSSLPNRVVWGVATDSFTKPTPEEEAEIDRHTPKETR